MPLKAHEIDQRIDRLAALLDRERETLKAMLQSISDMMACGRIYDAKAAIDKAIKVLEDEKRQ